MTQNNHPINIKKAISFLKSFRGEGYMNLVAIHPISADVAGITRPVKSGDLVKFITRYNTEGNLYFMVNEPHNNAPDTKLKKEHINKIHGVWLDADPSKHKPFTDERIRLSSFMYELSRDDNPPTYIIDSGGGFQAFWLLNNPVIATKETIDHYESLSRGLAEKYGTDHVHNIDRLMRIPFTLNIPTKKKIELGRTEVTSKVFYAASKEGIRYE